MPCACVAPETNLLPFYVGSAGTNIKTNPKLICFGSVICLICIDFELNHIWSEVGLGFGIYGQYCGEEGMNSPSTTALPPFQLSTLQFLGTCLPRFLRNV